MAITVTEANRGEYVELKLTGSIEYGSGESIHAALTAFVDRHPGSLFLIDVAGLRGRPDVLQALQTIEVIPADKIEKVRKMAVIDKASFRATVLVGQAAFSQRGLNIKWFGERAEALEWLLE